MEAEGLASTERSLVSGNKDTGTEWEVKCEGTPCYLTVCPEQVQVLCQTMNYRVRFMDFMTVFFVGSVDFLPEGRRLPAGCQSKFSIPRLVS